VPFSRVIEDIFEGLPKFAAYLDDVLVTGASEQELLANLK